LILRASPAPSFSGFCVAGQSAHPTAAPRPTARAAWSSGRSGW
jgi:hypothetical protein